MKTKHTADRTRRSAEARAARLHDLILAWGRLLADLDVLRDRTPEVVFEFSETESTLGETCDAIHDVQARLCWMYSDAMIVAGR